MKDALLKLLKSRPETAGRCDEFLDTLADDVQAVIIRALVPGDPNDPLVELEHQVEDIYADHFGVRLSNLFTVEPFNGKKKLYYSARARVVKAMIQAMLLEQADQYDRNDSEQAGEQLKARLAELQPTSTLLN